MIPMLTLSIEKACWRIALIDHRINTNSLGANPFPISIIKSNNETIGIIRVGFLGHWRYWNTALKVWESYKKTFEGKCDGDCKWSFQQEVEKELTNNIIDGINELKF